MLRALVVTLLVLNLGFLAWSAGWVEQLSGQPAHGGREPERLKRQLAPDSIKVAPAVQPAASAVSAAKAAPICLESALLAGDEALRSANAALERAGVPAGAVADQRSERPGVWAVLTIKMPNRDFQARKEETLKRMHVPFEPLKGLPAEDPSLLISRHDSEAAAEKAMEGLSQRLIKGLRVLQLSPALAQHRLRLEQADAAWLTKLQGAGFARCEAPVAAAAASAASR
nr:hypothetical protein [uncultured Roseateles sp.]